jgi:hypothetical protein
MTSVTIVDDAPFRFKLTPAYLFVFRFNMCTGEFETQHVMPIDEGRARYPDVFEKAERAAAGYEADGEMGGSTPSLTSLLDDLTIA